MNITWNFAVTKRAALSTQKQKQKCLNLRYVTKRAMQKMWLAQDPFYKFLDFIGKQKCTYLEDDCCFLYGTPTDIGHLSLHKKNSDCKAILYRVVLF